MQTLLHILNQAGGRTPSLYLKIEHEPYVALVIEATDESGPTGLPCISVAHYGEQNGDLMRDPEMCFEVHEKILGLSYYRNDYLGIEQWIRIERALENDYLSRDPSLSKRGAYIRRTMTKARDWASR